MADGNDLGKTSLGIEPHVAGLLAYVGVVVTGIIFFVLEKENKFVKFHAMQSILVSVAMFLVSVVLSFMPLLAPLVNLASLALWIVCMIQAYQGKWFRLPVVGDIAAKQAGI